jgi:hypothetical protein
MQNYLLILIVVLIIVIVGILYLGNRELNKTKVLLNQLQNDVAALQSGLSHLNTHPNFTPQQMNYFMQQQNEPTEEELHHLMQTEVLHSNEDYQGEWEHEVEEEEEEVGSQLVEEELSEEEVSQEEVVEEEQVAEQETVELFEPEIVETRKSSSSKKSTPNLKPSDYETGHKVVSENDGNTYEVVENKNGRKRWKKTNEVIESSLEVSETSEEVVEESKVEEFED